MCAYSIMAILWKIKRETREKHMYLLMYIWFGQIYMIKKVNEHVIQFKYP